VAASARDPSPSAAGTGAEVLPPVTAAQRSALGIGICVLGILAVVLVAAEASPQVRAPIVLLAALLLPGFPIVARMRLDLPTLIAVDVVTSLALDGGLALLTVETHLWHPRAMGLALACFGVGATFVTLTAIRYAEARHLT
jgi:hypothetical protein